MEACVTGDRIESLDDLRPGDLMLTAMSGAPARALVYGGQLLLGEHVRLGKFVVGHAGIVTMRRDYIGPELAGPDLVQAMPRGAEEIELLPSTHWNAHTLFARLPNDYDTHPAGTQGYIAAQAARQMIGTPYSFASYAALAAWRFGMKTPRLEAWIDRRDEHGYPREAICSVLVDQAWTLAGKRVCKGVAKQAVTPGELTLQLLATPGVIWGGAAWGR